MKKRILACLLATIVLVGCGNQTEDESNSNDYVLLDESEVDHEEIDERYLYDDGRARHEPESGTAAVEGYVTYIKNSPIYEEIQNQEYCYMLAYITEDDVPDLLIAPTEGSHAGKITLLYYPFNGVTEDDIIAVENLGCYNRISFYPWYNVLKTEEPGHMECSGEYYNRVDVFVDNPLERLAYHEAYYDVDDYDNVIEEHYYLGTTQEVSEDEYNSYISELVGNAEEVVFDSFENENNYHILDQEALDNNLFSDEFFSQR